MQSVLIAIPTAKYIESETFKSIFDLDVPDYVKVDFRYYTGYQIDHIRNNIANSAKSYDYLFAVDSDMTFPSDTLTRLMAHDVDLVSGIYMKKRLDPVEYEIYSKDQQGKLYSIVPESQSLFEIDACGFGCVLIKTSVFDRIDMPYFYNTGYDLNALSISEDLYFCKKLRYAGIKMWADPQTVCGHIGSYLFKPN
jgi:hypothetical protein